VCDDGDGVARVSVVRHGDSGADRGLQRENTSGHGDGGAEQCGREQPGSRVQRRWRWGAAMGVGAVRAWEKKNGSAPVFKFGST
jgi:hypothetical protein